MRFREVWSLKVTQSVYYFATERSGGEYRYVTFIDCLFECLL